jgi:hypothetical protein
MDQSQQQTLQTILSIPVIGNMIADSMNINSNGIKFPIHHRAWTPIVGNIIYSPLLRNYISESDFIAMMNVFDSTVKRTAPNGKIATAFILPGFILIIIGVIILATKCTGQCNTNSPNVELYIVIAGFVWTILIVPVQLVMENNMVRALNSRIGEFNQKYGPKLTCELNVQLVRSGKGTRKDYSLFLVMH